jgi:ADP-sugar diphosphatase
MIEYTFSTAIDKADWDVLLHCSIYQDWITKVQKKFKVSAVHFASVDFFSKRHEPLFIKLNAVATLPDGKPVHGVVFVRGNAVGVLVVLRCEGKSYLLLVDQPRFAIGNDHSLEIPAGILDWSRDYRKVALSELREEAQIDADDAELIDLTEFWHEPGVDGFAASCGVLDEFIRLYAIERIVTRAELRAMDGRKQEYLDENEWIKTTVLPYEEAAHKFVDGKNLIALFMYERWLRSQGRSL